MIRWSGIWMSKYQMEYEKSISTICTVHWSLPLTLIKFTNPTTYWVSKSQPEGGIHFKASLQNLQKAFKNI